jgi:hypothetical protein
MIGLNPQRWPDKAATHHLFPPEDDYFTQLFAKNIETSWKLMPLLMKGCSMLQDIMVLEHNENHTWMALVKTTVPKITTSYSHHQNFE